MEKIEKNTQPESIESQNFDCAPIHRLTQNEDGSYRGTALVTRVGVFKYPQPDGTVHHVLRHPDEVFNSDSLQTLKLRPMTNGHPRPEGMPRTDGLVTPRNATRVTVGTTGESIIRDGDRVAANLVINDHKTINDIKNGRRQISCGYTSITVPKTGVYQGEKYTHAQTRIKYNHVALVPSGRAGPEVSINVDSIDSYLDSFYDEGQNSTKNEEKHMTEKLKTITLDGIDYQSSPEVINKISKQQAELESAQKNLDAKEQELKSARSQNEKLSADLDHSKEKLQEATSLDHSEDISKKAVELASLFTVARATLDSAEDIEKMSAIEIKKAVIQKKSPQAVLDGKSEEYISARYDAALESVTNDSVNASGQAAFLKENGQLSKKNDHRDQWETHLKNAWKKNIPSFA